MGILKRISERVTGGWLIYLALCFAGLLIGVCIGAFELPKMGIRAPDPALSEILKKARYLNNKIKGGICLIELRPLQQDFEFAVLEWERKGVEPEREKIRQCLVEAMIWQSRLAGYWEISIKHEIVLASAFRDSPEMEYLGPPINGGVVTEWKNGIELIDMDKLKVCLLGRFGEFLDRLEAAAAKVGE